MSISELMNAVREGTFEKEFKSCGSTEDKVELFKKYGITISLEQYKNIESQVSAIKNGAASAYNIFKSKKGSGENKVSVSEFELSGVSAGKKLNDNERAVYESLTKIPGIMVENSSD